MEVAEFGKHVQTEAPASGSKTETSTTHLGSGGSAGFGERYSIAEIVAAIHEAEPPPLELAHDEDIGGWSAKIGDCLLACGGSMGFWSIVRATGLAPVEVLLGLLLGSGCLIDPCGAIEDFYQCEAILVRGIDQHF